MADAQQNYAQTVRDILDKSSPTRTMFLGLLIIVIVLSITATIAWLSGRTVCEENTTRVCDCPGGVKGAQTCSSHMWTRCACGSSVPRGDGGAAIADATAPNVSSALDECVSLRRNNNTGKTQYLIPSLTWSINIEHPSDGTAIRQPQRVTRRVVTSERHYHLLALSPLHGNEDFFRDYWETAMTGAVAPSITVLPGTHLQVAHGRSNIFEVYLSPTRSSEVALAPGDWTSIWTGARYEYRLPLSGARSCNARGRTLGASEDCWSYPNDEDVICELTILITSRSLSLRVPESGGALTRRDNNTVENVATRFDYDGGSALVYRWRRVIPGTEVALAFSW